MELTVASFAPRALCTPLPVFLRFLVDVDCLGVFLPSFVDFAPPFGDGAFVGTDLVELAKTFASAGLAELLLLPLLPVFSTFLLLALRELRDKKPVLVGIIPLSIPTTSSAAVSAAKAAAATAAS